MNSNLESFLIHSFVFLYSVEDMSVVVPIIDLSTFINPNATREEKLKVAQEINKAAVDVGFLTIVGHQIPLEVIDSAWKSTKDFFDMPLEEKMKCSRPQDVYPFGYNSM